MPVAALGKRFDDQFGRRVKGLYSLAVLRLIIELKGRTLPEAAEAYMFAVTT